MSKNIDTDNNINKLNKSNKTIISQRECVFIDSSDPNSPNQVINGTSTPFFRPEFPPKTKLQDLITINDRKNNNSNKHDSDGNSICKAPCRAPNAFIIYRKACVETIRSKGCLFPMTVISSISSQAWREEPEIVKDEYKRLADEAGAYYKQNYPKTSKHKKREKWNLVSFDDNKPSNDPCSPSPSTSSTPYSKPSKKQSNLKSFKSIKSSNNKNKNKNKKNPNNINNNSNNTITPSLSLINNNIIFHPDNLLNTPQDSIESNSTNDMTTIATTTFESSLSSPGRENVMDVEIYPSPDLSSTDYDFSLSTPNNYDYNYVNSYNNNEQPISTEVIYPSNYVNGSNNMTKSIYPSPEISSNSHNNSNNSNIDYSNNIINNTVNINNNYNYNHDGDDNSSSIGYNNYDNTSSITINNNLIDNDCNSSWNQSWCSDFIAKDLNSSPKVLDIMLSNDATFDALGLLL